MSENNNDNVFSLGDMKEKAKQLHRAKCLKMMQEHPELFDDAIIISPSGKMALIPETMGETHAVGILEASKFGILFARMMDSMRDDK